MSSDNDNDAQALGALRERIDSIDEQLQKLLNERADCALQVGAIKQAAGAESAVYFRPEREAQILSMLKARNTGPLPDDAVATLFREII